MLNNLISPQRRNAGHSLFLLIAMQFFTTFVSAQVGLVQTPYGSVSVQEFAASTCNGTETFKVQIYHSGGIALNGLFIVDYDPNVFQITDLGQFTQSTPSQIGTSVAWPMGAGAWGSTLVFTGKLINGATSCSFNVGFLSFQPFIVYAHTLTTPTVVNITGGDLETLTMQGGPLLSPNSALTTPQYVVVSGLLRADINYTFAPGSELFFTGTTAGMDVDEGAQLTLSGSSLYGCTTVWRGVEAKNGRLNVWGRPSLVGETIVRDASIAVKVETAGALNCEWARFRKNGICVLVPPNSGNRRFVDVVFSATHFEGVGPMLDGSNSIVGVSLNDVETIEFPFTFAIIVRHITFKGFRVGLYAQNSSAKLTRIFFWDMEENGIYARDNSVIDYDGTLFPPPSGAEWNCDLIAALFSGMPTAVRIIDSYLDFRRGTIKFVRTGFDCTQSKSTNVTKIVRSCIDATEYGCKIIASNNVRGDIQDNTIRVTGGGPGKGYGIGIFDQSTNVGNATGVWKITENDIQVHGRAAIEAQNAENVQVRANPKIINYANNRVAVKIIGGQANEVECNPFISSTDVGILCMASKDADISCNSVNAGNIALNIVDDCSISKIRGNTLLGYEYDLTYGTDVFNYALSGDQTYARNSFVGLGNDLVKAKHFEPIQPNIVRLSDYIVTIEGDHPCPDDPNAFPLFDAITPDWFRDLYSNESCDFQCPYNSIGQCTEVVGFTGGNGGYSFDDKDPLVRDDTWALHYPDAVRWDAKRNLYRNLGKLNVVPSNYLTFYQNMGNTSVGQLYQFEQSLESAKTLSSSTQQGIDNLLADRTALFEDMSALSEWIWQNEEWVWDAQVAAQKQAIRADIAAVNVQLSNITQTIRQSIAAQLSALNALNNSVSDTEIFEQNQKILNAYHLKELEFGAEYLATASEMLAIEQIALQCPLEGGSAVYQARAIMEKLTGDWYDDNVLCDLGQRPLSVTRLDQGTVLLFPNPADESIRVFTNDAVTLLILFDAQGRALQDIEVGTNGTADINTSSWPSGLYVLTARNTMGNIHTQRFVVKH